MVRTVDGLTVGIQRIVDQFLDSTRQVKDGLSSHDSSSRRFVNGLDAGQPCCLLLYTTATHDDDDD